MKILGSAGMLLAATTLGACSFLPGGRDDTEDAAATVPVIRTDLALTVLARGELVAIQESPIAVPQVPTGALKVKEVVPEGTIVEAGAEIVVFDESQLNIELANQTATFRSANRRIDRTHIQWGRESDAIRVDRIVAELERDYASEFQLQDEAIYSKLEILEAALDREYAEEKILFANARLLLRGEYYDIDEVILNVEKDQARDKIDRAETSLARLILTAPMGGMVVYRKNWRGATVSVGDTLWPGNVVLSIVDPVRTALRVNVLERDATGVRTGARASVRIDARAEREFTARVESVSELSRPIEEGSPVKYFEARVVLDEGDPVLLKPGMKGEARIAVAEMKDVLVIPRAAVRGADGEYHVLVAGPAGPVRRPVQLGDGDLVRVSIDDGLAEGESVLLTDAPTGEVEGGSEAPAAGEAAVRFPARGGRRAAR